MPASQQEPAGQREGWRLVLRDLRTGERREFSSWAALERHVQRAVRCGLR